MLAIYDANNSRKRVKVRYMNLKNCDQNTADAAGSSVRIGYNRMFEESSKLKTETPMGTAQL